MKKAHHECCIPGCYSEVAKQRRESGKQITFRHFGSPNPKFSRDAEQREWADSMMKFVLSYRDPKKTAILHQYHVGTVKICERHFSEEDMISKKGVNGKINKKLKYGVLPTLNLPLKGGRLLPDPYAKHPVTQKRPRKPPTERAAVEVIKNRTFLNLCSAAKRIATNASSEWNVESGDDIIKLTKLDIHRHDQNQFEVWIRNDFKIGMSCFGWCLPEGHSLLSYDLHANTMSSFLTHIESRQLCQGVIVPTGLEDSSLLGHYVTKKADPFSSESALSSTLALRARQCEVLMQSANERCPSCERRNKTLVAEWIEHRAHLQKNQDKPNKRPDSDFWQDQAKNLAKRFKPSEDSTIDVKCTTVAIKEAAIKEASLLPSVELTSQSQDRSSDIPSKQTWIKPIEKFAELMPEGRKIFEMFWATQMERLYLAAFNGCKDYAFCRSYPKELLEFWSEVWQAGKSGYRKLASSGLIAMPSPSTLTNYMKKKLENVDQSISKVLTTGKTESCYLDETTGLFQAETADTPATYENGVVVEAMQQARLPTDTASTGSNMLNSAGDDSDNFQLLLIGEEQAPVNDVMIPATTLDSVRCESAGGDIDSLNHAAPASSACTATTSAPPAGIDLTSLERAPSAHAGKTGDVRLLPAVRSTLLKPASTSAPVSLCAPVHLLPTNENFPSFHALPTKLKTADIRFLQSSESLPLTANIQLVPAAQTTVTSMRFDIQQLATTTNRASTIRNFCSRPDDTTAQSPVGDHLQPLHALFESEHDRDCTNPDASSDLVSASDSNVYAKSSGQILSLGSEDPMGEVPIQVTVEWGDEV